MSKSIRVTTKKSRGRPKTTGKGTQVGERWHADELKTIDAWISGSGEKMTRGQAIRRLVELGLAVKANRHKSSDSQKLRAREMAGKAIDGMTDDNANAEDQAGRKRRLLKGPEEFRDVRVDRAKKK